MNSDTGQRTGEDGRDEVVGRRVAPAPTGSGRIGVVGPVLAVLLVGLGALLLREALVSSGTVTGGPWLPRVTDALDGLPRQWWLVPAGLAAVLLGLWLVLTALRRRTRKNLAVSSRTGVYLHTRDVARLASGAARQVDGVLAASSSASRRAVRVRVEALAAAGVRGGVTEAVQRQLQPLQKVPRIAVDVHAPGGRTDRAEEGAA